MFVLSYASGRGGVRGGQDQGPSISAPPRTQAETGASDSPAAQGDRGDASPRSAPRGQGAWPDQRIDRNPSAFFILSLPGDNPQYRTSVSRISRLCSIALYGTDRQGQEYSIRKFIATE